MSASPSRRLQFRPPLWAWLGLLPCLALLIALGTWQLDRGIRKIALQQTLDEARQQAPTALSRSSEAAQKDSALHARAAGRYDSAHQLLLDNEGYEGRAGYHVLTPLRLDDGAIVIVNRGWVPQTASRSQLPDIAVGEEARQVVGLWREPARPGLRLAVDNCAGDRWPRVLQYPEVKDFRCLLGEAVLPGVLLLQADAADGYVRDWRVSTGFPPQRHYAYAAQWYAFAATLLFLFVKLNLKRIPRSPDA